MEGWGGDNRRLEKYPPEHHPAEVVAVPCLL